MRALNALRAKDPDIEAIAAMGHSGQLLMGAVSYLTGLPQIAVRKEIDISSSHDSRRVNGWVGCKSYVIIDDFVSSGNTIDKIIKGIEEEYSRLWKCNYSDYLVRGAPPPEKCVPKVAALLLYETSQHYTYRTLHNGERFHDVIGYSVRKFEEPLTVDYVRAKDGGFPTMTAAASVWSYKQPEKRFDNAHRDRENAKRKVAAEQREADKRAKEAADAVAYAVWGNTDDYCSVRSKRAGWPRGRNDVLWGPPLKKRLPEDWEADFW